MSSAVRRLMLGGLPLAIACLFSPGATSLAALINFETISSGQPITDQFAGLGVFFSPGLFADSTPATSINGTREATIFGPAAGPRNPITATFLVPQSSAEFHVSGDNSVITGSTFRVRAFLGTRIVDVQEFVAAGDHPPGGTLPSKTIRVAPDGGFTRIEIARTNSRFAFSMDDFSFLPGVPEPTALALAGLPLLAGGIAETNSTVQSAGALKAAVRRPPRRTA